MLEFPRKCVSFVCDGIECNRDLVVTETVHHSIIVPDFGTPVQRVRRACIHWNLIEYEYDEDLGLATMTYERHLPADEMNPREHQVAVVQIARPNNRNHGWWEWHNGKRTPMADAFFD
jgi:hypothetical protein